MGKQQNLEFIGEVTQELGNAMFRVVLEDKENFPALLCTVSGKIRKNYIKIIAGDRVKVEVSPYDLTKGRIVTRLPTASNNSGTNVVNKKPSINHKKKK